MIQSDDLKVKDWSLKIKIHRVPNSNPKSEKIYPCGNGGSPTMTPNYPQMGFTYDDSELHAKRMIVLKQSF